MVMNTENMGVREKIGEIFRDLTHQMYGGEKTTNGISDSVYGNPDILQLDRNQVYESKGGISSDHHKLRPDQVEHYRKIRAKVGFPEDHRLHGLRRAEPYYFFWQHKKRGISSIDQEDLEETILTNVTRLLIVSYDIISAGERHWARTGASGPWTEQITFRSSERTQMTNDYRAGLKSLSLAPGNYDYSDETIPKGEYTYATQFTEGDWEIEVPKFRLTTVINKNWSGLERRTKEIIAEESAATPF